MVQPQLKKIHAWLDTFFSLDGIGLVKASLVPYPSRFRWLSLPCFSSLLLSSRLPSPTPLAHCSQVSTSSHFPSGNVIGQTIFDARTTARTIHTLPAGSGTTLFSVVGRRGSFFGHASQATHTPTPLSLGHTPPPLPPLSKHALQRQFAALPGRRPVQQPP